MNFEAAILQDLEDEILDNISAKPQINGFGPPRDRRTAGKHVHNSVVSVSHANGSNDRSTLPRGNTLQTHAQVESYPE